MTSSTTNKAAQEAQSKFFIFESAAQLLQPTFYFPVVEAQRNSAIS